MEEPKSNEIPKATSHLTAAVTPPQNPESRPQSQPSKRKLCDQADLHNSAYFKIRALACQLRPYFFQVLETPDFLNCKAAHEIRLQMKLMVELYKQMIVETGQLETIKSACRPLADDNLLGKHFSGGLREEKKSGTPQLKPTLQESLEEKHQTPHFSSEKSLHRQSYIVGGSVSGSNFITFLGSKPVYYGATKESIRRSYNKSFARTK